jgi:hypothetical protein
LVRVPEITTCVAIDWSGAKGRRHKGIAIAEARGDDAPQLVRPGHVWSREEVLDWLLERAAEGPTLFGFDFSFAPPFVERGAYLPGEEDIPEEARSFWAYVDRTCDDEDLGAASFLERAHRRHFYFGAADGVKAGFMHFRRCEVAFNARGGGKASSVYDAIGAAQVAKASFSGMRLLHHLGNVVAIWPFDDPIPRDRSAVVEIYSRLFLKAARTSGRKLRSIEALNAALAELGSPPTRIASWLTDHETDALVTAAGMRAHLANPMAFAPPGLKPNIARTEGWTFGIV